MYQITQWDFPEPCFQVRQHNDNYYTLVKVIKGKQYEEMVSQLLETIETESQEVQDIIAFYVEENEDAD